MTEKIPKCDKCHERDGVYKTSLINYKGKDYPRLFCEECKEKEPQEVKKFMYYRG
jgi:hypothetical protein